MNILEKSIRDSIESGIEYNTYNKIIILYNKLCEEQFYKGIKIGLFILSKSLDNNLINFKKIKEDISENYKYLLDSPESCFSVHLKQYRLGQKQLPNYEDLIKYSKICEKELIKEGLKFIETIHKEHANYDKIQKLIQKIEKQKEKNENY